MKNYLVIFLKGLLMGFADIIPGVSGGTIAFITGIYDRLITALKNIGTFIKIFFGRIFGTTKEKLWKNIDFGLFIPLALGIGIAMWTGAHFIPNLLNNYPAQTYSLFIGLILASAYFVFKHIKKHTLKGVVILVLGLAFGVWISTLQNPLGANPSFLSTFILGAIAICAMILPGISGSYILLILGHYEFMLGAISGLNIPIILTFGAGAIIGLLVFSRVLAFLLKKYHPETFSALLGLMIGALYHPIEVVVMSCSGISTVIVSVILAIVAAAIVLIIERHAGKKKGVWS